MFKVECLYLPFWLGVRRIMLALWKYLEKVVINPLIDYFLS